MVVSERNLVEEIKCMIQATPHASREEVERYHGEIIKLLDYGGVIDVPSPVHRNLHQSMWIKGFEVYTEFKDSVSAGLNFSNSVERERFNMWYAKKYILEKKLDPWEQEIIRVASEDCMRNYKHPLEVLTNDELLK